MLLDDLYQAIEKLRERMEIHQDKLKQSEALTRNALVDPRCCAPSAGTPKTRRWRCLNTGWAAGSRTTLY